MFHRFDSGSLKAESGVVSGAVAGGFEVPFDCRTKDYLGITDLMRRKKVLVNENGYRTIRVCGGRTKLLFQSANQFGDLSGLSKSINSLTSKIDVFVIGGGIHNMVTHGDNEKPLVSWLSRINSLKYKNSIGQIIVVGTHYRVIELAPIPYRDYAKGPQGNKKIRRWNEIMKQHSEAFTFVNPYNITSSLTENYEDTEDGMHMGFWINLQKVFIVLKSLRY
eukprot:Stramenopile-MAST_4_protein_3741